MNDHLLQFDPTPPVTGAQYYDPCPNAENVAFYTRLFKTPKLQWRERRGQDNNVRRCEKYRRTDGKKNRGGWNWEVRNRFGLYTSPEAYRS